MADTLQHAPLDGEVTWHAGGDANHYSLHLTKPDGRENWLARIHLNGEFLSFRQEQMMTTMSAALNDGAAVARARAEGERTFPMPALTAAEVAMVLAGLRMLQTFAGPHHDRMPVQLLAILEDGGIDGPLSAETIDDLCDRLNRA